MSRTESSKTKNSTPAAALTPRECMGILRITRKQFYQLVKRRDLPAFRVGNQWRVRPAALKEFMHDGPEPE
jgi:excisionase family DNA binding protein